MCLPTPFKHYVTYAQPVPFLESAQIDPLGDEIVANDDRVDAEDLEHLQRNRRHFATRHVLSFEIGFTRVIPGETATRQSLYVLAVDVPTGLRSLDQNGNVADLAPAYALEYGHKVLYLAPIVCLIVRCRHVYRRQG